MSISHPRDRLKKKLAGKPPTHHREKVKRNKKTEIARKKLELEKNGR